MFLILIACGASTLAGVSNEFLLKDIDKNLSFWEKSVFLYGCGLIINLGFMVSQNGELISWLYEVLHSVFDGDFFASILRGKGLGYSVTDIYELISSSTNSNSISSILESFTLPVYIYLLIKISIEYL